MSPFKHLSLLVPAALLATAAVGCGSEVIGGGEDDDDIGCGGAGCIEEPSTAPTALMIEEDGQVRLYFASFGLSCDDGGAALPLCRAQEDFLLSVTMPASYLVAGSTVSFEDPAVDMFTQVRGGAEADGQCVSGGGGGGFGSMRILALGPTSATIAVDEGIITLDSDHDGRAFEVERCNPPPVDPPLGTNALAYYVNGGYSGYDGGHDGYDGGFDDGAGPDGELPPSQFTTVGVGGYPMPSRVVFQIADHTLATCEDPYATPRCPEASRSLSVSVLADQVYEGAAFRLDDPEVYVSFTDQGPNEDADDCWWGGGGGALPGVMTLESVAQTGFRVAFEGTGDDLIEGQHNVARCY